MHEGGIDGEGDVPGGDVGYDTLPDEDRQGGGENADEEQGEVCGVGLNTSAGIFRVPFSLTVAPLLLEANEPRKPPLYSCCRYLHRSRML